MQTKTARLFIHRLAVKHPNVVLQQDERCHIANNNGFQPVGKGPALAFCAFSIVQTAKLLIWSCTASDAVTGVSFFRFPSCLLSTDEP